MKTGVAACYGCKEKLMFMNQNSGWIKQDKQLINDMIKIGDAIESYCPECSEVAIRELEACANS